MSFFFILLKFVFYKIFFVELLNEEKVWLDKVQSIVSQSRIGADAEELSEELDVIKEKKKIYLKKLN